MIKMENHRYNYLYKALNGPPPSKVYELNFQFDNIYECGICIDKFCKLQNGDESILKCGHRYHELCLREWELIQFKNNPYSSYQCPLCRKEYGWRDKYNYIYIKDRKLSDLSYLEEIELTPEQLISLQQKLDYIAPYLT